MKYIAILLLSLILAACGNSGTATISVPAVNSEALPIHSITPVSILIVGDMWSVSWTPDVQQLEYGIANVNHAVLAAPTLDSGAVPENDEDSATEAVNIDTWLGSHSYAIVHFDAELDYDTCHGTQYKNSIAGYVANLVYIAKQIQAAGSVAIYGTGLTDSCHPDASVQVYNAAAVAALEPMGVRIDNLYPLGPVNIPVSVSQTELLAAHVVQSFGYIPY